LFVVYILLLTLRASKTQAPLVMLFCIIGKPLMSTGAPR
jgi:hypothetical protein